MANTSTTPPQANKRPAKAKSAAKPRPASQKPPTLADLKREVYALAKVSSTKELKRTHMDLGHLDFRLKLSWRSALEVLQQSAAAYPGWQANPPRSSRSCSRRSSRPLRPMANRSMKG